MTKIAKKLAGNAARETNKATIKSNAARKLELIGAASDATILAVSCEQLSDDAWRAAADAGNTLKTMRDAYAVAYYIPRLAAWDGRNSAIMSLDDAHAARRAYTNKALILRDDKKIAGKNVKELTDAYMTPSERKLYDAMGQAFNRLIKRLIAGGAIIEGYKARKPKANKGKPGKRAEDTKTKTTTTPRVAFEPANIATPVIRKLSDWGKMYDNLAAMLRAFSAANGKTPAGVWSGLDAEILALIKARHEQTPTPPAPKPRTTRGK